MSDINPEVLVQLLGQAIAQAQNGNDPRLKHSISSPSPTTNLMHGPGGIFGVSGLDQDLFSTRVKPSGLLSVLPAFSSRTMNPIVGYLTGLTAAGATQPDAVCDDPPDAGQLKSGTLTAQFGRVSYKSEDLEVNRIGQIINRGEFTDLRVVNDPILDEHFGVPDTVDGNATRAILQEVMARLLTVGVAFENALSQMVWAGNPTNNTAGGGYKEFPGMDILIGTGKVDALNGVALPSLDSDVKDFNYQLVDGSSPTIVEALTYLYRFVKHNAITMNMMPTQWAFVMREELFYELSAVWPCIYDTWRCNVQGDNSRVFVDGRAEVEFRDKMRTGQFLLIDGVQIEVIFDTGIVEENGSAGSANFNANLLDGAQFASNIYLVPMTVVGGRPVTFLEYFDYSGSGGAMEGIAQGNFSSEFWTDGGRFLWTKQHTNWCVNWLAKIEPRLRLLTPHLAGRLDNVAYQPLQHTRDPFNDDPYFVDGGNTSRTSPSLQFEWDL